VTLRGTVVEYDRRADLHTVALEKSFYTRKSTFPDTVQVSLHDRRYWVLASRGPLRHLLYYDLACFVAVCTLASLTMIGAHSRGNLKHAWQWRAALTMAQIGYSICAWPFFFANIPPWRHVFTHARVTGYNKRGDCVPLLYYKEYPWVLDSPGGGAAAEPRSSQQGTRDRLPVEPNAKDPRPPPPAEPRSPAPPGSRDRSEWLRYRRSTSADSVRREQDGPGLRKAGELSAANSRQPSIIPEEEEDDASSVFSDANSRRGGSLLGPGSHSPREVGRALRSRTPPPPRSSFEDHGANQRVRARTPPPSTRRWRPGKRPGRLSEPIAPPRPLPLAAAAAAGSAEPPASVGPPPTRSQASPTPAGGGSLSSSSSPSAHLEVDIEAGGMGSSGMPVSFEKPRSLLSRGVGWGGGGGQSPQWTSQQRPA